MPAEVDRITGYRYYRPEQIDTMNYIQRLKRYGFTLEEIQNLLSLSDNKRLTDMLRQQKEKLKQEQQEMAIILNELQTHISVFERTGDIMSYQKSYAIEVKDSPCMNVLAVRAVMGVDEFGKYFGTLFERVPREHVTPTRLNGARYYDEEFNHESNDTELSADVMSEDRSESAIPSDRARPALSGAALHPARNAQTSSVLQNRNDLRIIILFLLPDSSIGTL